MFVEALDDSVVREPNLKVDFLFSIVNAIWLLLWYEYGQQLLHETKSSVRPNGDNTEP